jgi:hypothetical protein
MGANQRWHSPLAGTGYTLVVPWVPSGGRPPNSTHGYLHWPPAGDSLTLILFPITPVKKVQLEKVSVIFLFDPVCEEPRRGFRTPTAFRNAARGCPSPRGLPRYRAG